MLVLNSARQACRQWDMCPSTQRSQPARIQLFIRGAVELACVPVDLPSEAVGSRVVRSTPVPTFSNSLKGVPFAAQATLGA